VLPLVAAPIDAALEQPWVPARACSSGRTLQTAPLKPESWKLESPESDSYYLL
jgi:hypothetical protein